MYNSARRLVRRPVARAFDSAGANVTAHDGLAPYKFGAFDNFGGAASEDFVIRDLLARFVAGDPDITGISAVRLLLLEGDAAYVPPGLLLRARGKTGDYGERNYDLNGPLRGFDLVKQDLCRHLEAMRSGLPTAMHARNVPAAVQRRLREIEIGSVYLQPVMDDQQRMIATLSVVSDDPSWRCSPRLQKVLAADAAALGWRLAHDRHVAALREEVRLQLIRAMTNLAGGIHAYVDDMTFEHQSRVAAIMKALAVRRGYSADQARFIAQAAMLHDIGKLGIPATILHKPGGLTPEERQCVELHTLYGDYVFRGEEALRQGPSGRGGRMTRLEEDWTPPPSLQLARNLFIQLQGFDTSKAFALFWQIARYHHEQLCGVCPDDKRRGYPDGLSWPELVETIGPESADVIRMMMIVDPFDAIYSRRSYRANAYSLEETLRLIQEEVDAGRRPADCLSVLRDILREGFDPTQGWAFLETNFGILVPAPRGNVLGGDTRLSCHSPSGPH